MRKVIRSDSRPVVADCDDEKSAEVIASTRTLPAGGVNFKALRQVRKYLEHSVAIALDDTVCDVTGALEMNHLLIRDGPEQIDCLRNDVLEVVAREVQLPFVTTRNCVMVAKEVVAASAHPPPSEKSQEPEP
jgi:hypothetical protein